MKPRHFFLCLFMAVLPSVGEVRAAEATGSSNEQSYRDYLEATRKAQEEYLKDKRISYGVIAVVVAGLVLLVIVPARRKMHAALELAEKQQKTLEEIRDLLKKP